MPPFSKRSESGNYAKKSSNVMQWNLLHSLGSSIPKSVSSTLNDPLINLIKSLKISNCYSGFNRRITALSWHCNEATTVAVGSKAGDIIIWNFEEDKQIPRMLLDGTGPGGQIMSLTFDERDNGRSLFVTSMDGGVCLRNLERNSPEFDKRFIWTNSIQHWYTMLDVCYPNGVMIAGESKGFVELLSIDGESQWKKRLHSNKVTHLEFSTKENWCFVTSSVDRTAKVWDVRKIKDEKSALFTLEHNRPVNSACFSRMHGGMLLTSDQCEEIRTYLCPSFSLSKTIFHPHRQFQHLTPIKASWHPLLDIAVVGRYPVAGDTEDIRSVDFIDTNTGDMLYQLTGSDTGNKIMSLNTFNSQGDKLLSSVGTSVVVWKPDFKDHQRRGRDSPNKDESERNREGKENKRKEFNLNREGMKKKRR